MQVRPYHWRPSGSFLAHLLKATTQQHHRALTPTIARLVPPTAVVFDVGAHAGQYTKLFARAANHGRQGTDAAIECLIPPPQRGNRWLNFFPV